MDIMKAIAERHSVRKYTDMKIEGETLAALQGFMEECNAQSGLKMQLCLNVPDVTVNMVAAYGKFDNVHNYIAIVGNKQPGTEEKCGYFGEKLVIEAQRLGLNTCWIAGTYRKGKSAVQLGEGEKLYCIISIGYGANSGNPHKNKPLESHFRANGTPPDWFMRGVEAARLAPTAINQQRFRFILEGGNVVRAKKLLGPYTSIDLGIVKYHFEMGAGAENFVWRD